MTALLINDDHRITNLSATTKLEDGKLLINLSIELDLGVPKKIQIRDEKGRFTSKMAYEPSPSLRLDTAWDLS